MRAATITRFILTMSCLHCKRQAPGDAMRFPSCFRHVLIVAALIASVAGCGEESHQQLQSSVPTALPAEGILFEVYLTHGVDCNVTRIDVAGSIYRYPCGNSIADAQERDVRIPGFADTSYDWLRDSTGRDDEVGILLNRIGDSMLTYMYNKALIAGREVLPPLRQITWSPLTLRVTAFTPEPTTGELKEVLLLYTSDGAYQCRRGDEAGELVALLQLLHVDGYFPSWL